MSAEQERAKMEAYITLIDTGTDDDMPIAREIRSSLNAYWQTDYSALPCYMRCLERLADAS